MEKNYDDLLLLPHPVSATHPQMSMQERAAQFSPFAALTGYSDVIKETARLTDEWADPDEDRKEELDRRLAFLREHLSERLSVSVTCFLPDKKKAGGSYRTVSGVIRKIDAYGHRLILEDETVLLMEQIVWIDGEAFP